MRPKTSDQTPTPYNSFGAGLDEAQALKKHKDIIVMRPQPGRSISIMARKIYTSLLATAQQHQEGLGRPMLATEVYRAPFLKILNQIGLGEMQMRYAKEYVIEMAEWMVYWETANRDQAGSELDALGVRHMVVSPSLERDDQGALWFEWQLDAYVNQMIDPNRLKNRADHYAYINLVIAAKLSTYTSLALYEICAKFKDNYGGLTASKPTEWWIDALSSKAPTHPEKRRPWVKFKSEKIVPAVEEINTHSDLTLELLDNKASGEVSFRVTKKSMDPLALLKPVRLDQKLVQQGLAFGITEERLTILIQEFGDDLVKQCVTRLEEQVAQRGSGVIKSPFAWLKKVLENEQTTAQLAPPEPRLPAQELLEAVKGPQADVPQKMDGHEEEGRILQQAVGDFNLLSLDARQTWFEAATKALKDSGLRVPPRELQRHLDFRLSDAKGLLASKVLSLYLSSALGPNWREALGPRRIS